MRVSLITISPGDQVYEKFGHTALRIEELKGRFDIVFNYGLFDFDAPNFLYRFIKGETDYQLGVDKTSDFLTSYAMRGSGVTEQVINLNQDESQKLFHLLMENYKKENRVYRYNFFFDNCSTRPRDIILKSINNNVEFYQSGDRLTFRDLIYEKTGGENSWLSFGIDLLMGSRTDNISTYNQQNFLPDYLMRSFDNAQINSNGKLNSLVLEKKVIFEPEVEHKNEKWILSPLFVVSFLLIISGFLFYFEFKRGRIFKIIDSLIFIIIGLVGVVIYFLNFFSLHPYVDINYNCIWLQPLDILAGILIWVNSAKKILYYYHFANFVLLLVFLILCFFIPQHFNLAFYPLIMIIMSRSLLHTILGHKGFKIETEYK